MHPPPTHISTLSLHDAFRSSAIKLSFKQQPFLTYQLDLLPPRSDGLQVKLRSTKFAVPEYKPACAPAAAPAISLLLDRKSTRLNSSHRCISYAVFCLKKKKT